MKYGKIVSILLLLGLLLVAMQGTTLAKRTEKELLDYSRSRHLAEEYGISQDELLYLSAKGLSWDEIGKRLESIYPHKMPEIGNVQFAALSKATGISMVEAMKAYDMAARYHIDPVLIGELAVEAGSPERLEKLLEQRNSAMQYVYKDTRSGRTEVDSANLALTAAGTSFGYTGLWLSVPLPKGIDADDIINIIFLCQLQYREAIEEKQALFDEMLRGYYEIEKELERLSNSWPERSFPEGKLTDLREGVSQVAPTEVVRAASVVGIPSIVDISEIYNTDKVSPYKSYFEGKTEIIDPASGALIIKQVDFTLPGRNGLDFTLARVYNNQSAVASIPNPTITFEGYYINDGVNHFSNHTTTNYSDGSRDENYENIIFYYDSQESDSASAFGMAHVTLRFEFYNTEGVYEGEYVESFTTEAVMDADPYDVQTEISIQSGSEAEDFFERRFGLGVGWRLSLPTIEITEEDDIFLHMGDGNTYKVNGNFYGGGTGYFIEDYPIMDMRLDKDQEYSNGIDAKDSEFCLTLKSGVKYFFDEDGLILGIKDRFENEIRFENEGTGKDRHIKRAIDTVGREIAFSYITGGLSISIKETPQSSPLVTWQYSLADIGGEYANRKKLAYVTPPEGLPCSYDYSLAPATYDLVCDDYRVVGGSSQQTFHCLNMLAIWHQTNNPGDQSSARTIFTYSTAQRGNTSTGPVTEYFQVASRKDEVPGVLGLQQDGFSVFTYEKLTPTHQYNECIRTPQRSAGESGMTPAVETWRFDEDYRLIKHIVTGANAGFDRNQIETQERSYTYSVSLDGSTSKLPYVITTKHSLGSSSRTDNEVFVWDVLGNNIKYTDTEGTVHKYWYDSAFSLPTREVTITANNPDSGIVKEYTLGLLQKRITDVRTYNGYSSVNTSIEASYPVLFPPIDIPEASNWYWTTPEPVTKLVFGISWKTNSFFDTAAYKIYYRVSGASSWTLYKSKTHTMIIGGGSGVDTYTKTGLTLNIYDVRIEVTKSAVGVHDLSAAGPTYQWNPINTEKVTTEKLQYDANSAWLVTEHSVYKFNDTVIKESSTAFVYGNDKVAPAQIITQVTDAGGYTSNEITEATYDTLGRITSSNTYKQGDPNYLNTNTIVTYDDLGRVTEAQLPAIPNDQRKSLYTQYDDFNSVVVQIDPEGRQTKQTYDRLGRILKSEWLDSAQWKQSGTYEYDSLGMKIRSFDAFGATNETEYEYDAFGRTIKTTLPKIEPADMEMERQYSETWHSPLITYSMFPLTGFPQHPADIYNLNNNNPPASAYNYVAVRVEKSIAFKTGLEQETRTSYTAYDRKDRVIWQAVQTSATPTWNMVWNKYDKLGRLIASWVWVKNLNGTDVWDKTEYEYALHFDKPTLVKLPGNGTPEPFHTYAYDSRGLVIAEDVGTGYQVLTQYDSKGRAKNVQYGAGTDVMASKLYYNAAGALTIAKAYTNGIQDNQVNRTYDNRGQLIAEAWQFDNSTYTIGYMHDNSGNTTRISYPDSTYVDYLYDYRNLLVKIPGLFEGPYSSNGFLYDLNGRMIGIQSINNVETIRSYDGRGRLTGTTSTHTLDGDILDLAFSYTSQDNISSISEMTDNLDFTLDFGYDFVSRLTEAEVYGYQNRSKVLYSYDGAGNRLTEVWKNAQDLTVESFNYTYNPGNYLTYKGLSSFNTGSYGQIESRTEAGVTATYAYNPMRMMKQASEAGATLAKYEYDALGRRIISWLDDEWRTVSLWSGNDSIYEIRQEWATPPPNPPTETITRYVAVNGQYLAKLVGSSISMQPFFHHTDIVGTIRAVTDINGAVVARYAYEPFGSLTTASGLIDGELHRFTGKPSDLETSLSYFNARYYDPTLGRFTSSDPAKDGLNWFVYCYGNPLRYVDLNGLMYSETESDYNREAAVSYAITYGRHRNEAFDLLQDISLAKIYNMISKWELLGWFDCTNFISQCALAGGVEMDENWYFDDTQRYSWLGVRLNYSRSWTVAVDFGEWLRDSGMVDEEVLFTAITPSKISQIAQIAQPGDFVAYVVGDNIEHWMIISQVDKVQGIVYVTYHTKNSINVELKPNKDVLFFRILDSK